MTELSLVHHTFSLERRYPASAAGVFAAWRDPHAKRRWFADDKGEYALDFRVGGLEVVTGVGDNGKVLVFESRSSTSSKGSESFTSRRCRPTTSWP